MSAGTVTLQNRAYWLGYLGVLPLLLGVGLLNTRVDSALVLAGIQQYGAVILTFVGAIHWGRAMNSGDVELITISVMPSLLAWYCLFLSPSYGLPLLTSAFLLLFFLIIGNTKTSSGSGACACT